MDALRCLASETALSPSAHLLQMERISVASRCRGGGSREAAERLIWFSFEKRLSCWGATTDDKWWLQPEMNKVLPFWNHLASQNDRQSRMFAGRQSQSWLRYSFKVFLSNCTKNSCRRLAQGKPGLKCLAQGRIKSDFSTGKDRSLSSECNIVPLLYIKTHHWSRTCIPPRWKSFRFTANVGKLIWKILFSYIFVEHDWMTFLPVYLSSSSSTSLSKYIAKDISKLVVQKWQRGMFLVWYASTPAHERSWPWGLPETLL